MTGTGLADLPARPACAFADGAARSIRARSAVAPAAVQWRRRCRGGRAPAGGCSSRLRGAASAPCDALMRAAGRPNGGVRTPRAISAMIGNDSGGGRHAAGAGPDQRDRIEAVGIDGDRVGHAHHLRDRGILRHHGRMHALLDAGFGAHRDAEKLDAVAELVGGVEIGERDRGDAFDIDRALRRSWCRTRGSPGWRAFARCRGLRRRRSDRPRHSRAAAPPSGNRRTTAGPRSMRVRM